MQGKHILVVDDEKKTVEILSAYFEKEGCKVFKAYRGSEALLALDLNRIDLVVLDLMLPDISGEEICRKIRKKSRIPIIMLTAKTSEENLLAGLGIGADDYIFKPFSPRAVIAKANAVLRRVESDPLIDNIEQFGIMKIDYSSGLVLINNNEISLTPTERKILFTMAKAPGRTFSREQLIDFALDGDFGGFDRSIDTYIKSLRRKIEPDRKKPIYILTTRGIGYRFGGKDEN